MEIIFMLVMNRETHVVLIQNEKYFPSSHVLELYIYNIYIYIYIYMHATLHLALCDNYPIEKDT